VVAPPAPVAEDSMRGGVVAWIVAWVTGTFLSGLLYGLVGVVTMGARLTVQAGLWAGFVGVAFAWAHTRGGIVEVLGLRARWPELPIALVIGVAAQFVITVAYLPLYDLLDIGSDELEEPARQLAAGATGIGAVALVVMTLVGAPVAEEILYRGVLQRSLRRRYPAWLAIGLTATVFAASHFQALQFPALLFIGVVLGAVAERTGRIGPAIATHVGFNLVTTVVLLVVHDEVLRQAVTP
jgi:membrane protease YdiL (CAAX protease family)